MTYKNDYQSNVLKPVLITYLSCYIVRMIEYLFIRTDYTFLGEAFIHKLFGILVLIVVGRYLGYRLGDIGFKVNGAIRGTAIGLIIGIITFFIAYSVEYIISCIQGGNPTLGLYVTSFSLEGNMGNQTAFLFFALCILFNIVNAIMEEGVFRGFFLTALEKKNSFWKANLISALLFGFWHLAMPVRSFLDGKISLTLLFLLGLNYVFVTTILGIKLGLLKKATGSLWAPMANHFVNNTVINILHIVSSSGTDSLQFIRISIAQTLSFIIILLFYLKKSKN